MISTWLYTLFRGKFVGKDEFGNRYYHNPKVFRRGREKRWVLYKGRPEASRIPAEWHAWLHHVTDAPLTEAPKSSLGRVLPHKENVTGSSEAYRPKGSEYKGGKRAPATGDYEPWVPE